MTNDCPHCGPVALGLAAKYKIPPQMVTEVRSVKSGTVVRCCSCKREWVSVAKWVRSTSEGK